MRAHLRPAIVSLALFTILTGLIYPLIVTGVAQRLFPRQANGSPIVRDGQAVGSTLIGQPFDDAKYFWGRASGTAPFPYNAGASSGSNLGPTNETLRKAIRSRIEALRAADPNNQAPIPIDLVTASASGLDPHVSPAVPSTRSGGSPEHAGWTTPRCATSSSSTSKGASSASWASRESTCYN